MLEIVTYGNEILGRKAEPIKDIDDSIRTLAAEMLATMGAGALALPARRSIGRSGSS